MSNWSPYALVREEVTHTKLMPIMQLKCSGFNLVTRPGILLGEHKNMFLSTWNSKHLGSPNAGKLATCSTEENVSSVWIPNGQLWRLEYLN